MRREEPLAISKRVAADNLSKARSGHSLEPGHCGGEVYPTAHRADLAACDERIQVSRNAHSLDTQSSRHRQA
jgi:hypothetical protein